MKKLLKYTMIAIGVLVVALAGFASVSIYLQKLEKSKIEIERFNERYRLPKDENSTKKLCEDGDMTECVTLSNGYTYGTKSITKNFDKAKYYMKLVCDSGEEGACKEVKKIDKKYLSHLCVSGDETACIKLQKQYHKYYVSYSKYSKCGSTHFGRYVSGLVVLTDKMKEQEKKREVIFTGCMIRTDIDNPKYKCIDCKTDLYSKDSPSNY